MPPSPRHGHCTAPLCHGGQELSPLILVRAGGEQRGVSVSLPRRRHLCAPSPCRMPPSPTASTSCEKSTPRNSTAGKGCLWSPTAVGLLGVPKSWVEGDTPLLPRTTPRGRAGACSTLAPLPTGLLEDGQGTHQAWPGVGARHSWSPGCCSGPHAAWQAARTWPHAQLCSFMLYN